MKEIKAKPTLDGLERFMLAVTTVSYAAYLYSHKDWSMLRMVLASYAVVQIVRLMVWYADKYLGVEV